MSHLHWHRGGATPDFQTEIHFSGLTSGGICINPPKGPRPISSCELDVIGNDQGVVSIPRRGHARFPAPTTVGARRTASSGINPPKGPRPISSWRQNRKIGPTLMMYQSPEGATPDFQSSPSRPPPKPPIVSIPRRGHARFPAIFTAYIGSQTKSINPPKGPRPISSGTMYSETDFKLLYQSPEGATPDFQDCSFLAWLSPILYQSPVRLVSNESTGSRKELPVSGSGRMSKGTANVAEVGTAACKSRAVSTVRADASVTGYHRYYGEERAGRCLPFLKSVSNVSVRKYSPQGNAARARLVWGMPTGCIRHGYATSTTRLGRSSAQPGIQLTTYGATGWFIEQENSDSDAWRSKPGKPPSPAMFRAEGGALVVVRAWESHAHGEGGQ